MSKEELRMFFGDKCTDKQFASILSNPFMDNIDCYSFEMWKKGFVGAFITKNPTRPQVVRMMCEALHLSTIKWEDLTKVNLATVTEYIKSVVSPNSSCTYISLIKALLNEYSEEGIIPCKNFSSVLSSKKVPSQHIALTEEELKALDAYRPKSKTELDTKIIFMRACLTGSRSSDAKNLSRKNVSNGILSYVSRKTKTEINQPVHKQLSKYLDKPHKEHLTAVLNRTIQRICKEIGMTEEVQLYVGGKLQKGQKWEFVTMHTARRTFCTILAQKDVPVEVIRTLAGHSTTTMTDRYVCIDGKKPGVNAMTFFNN
jgi:tyrosine type site-specific recombinase